MYHDEYVTTKEWLHFEYPSNFSRVAKSTKPEQGHFTALDVLQPGVAQTHTRFRDASPVQCHVHAGDLLLLPSHLLSLLPRHVRHHIGRWAGAEVDDVEPLFD